MTCKDCLSYDVCMKWTDYWLDADRARDCEHFKNVNQIKAEAIKELDDKFGLCLAGYENAYIEEQNWCARNTVSALTFEFMDIVKEVVGDAE